jgi:F0F1-type ATP synthase delta subunit
VVRKTVIATVKVDQALLGGVVAELEGKIYDGSLATRLSEAQRRMMG